MYKTGSLAIYAAISWSVWLLSVFFPVYRAIQIMNDRLLIKTDPICVFYIHVDDKSMVKNKAFQSFEGETL
jgi:hypothetical protein